MPGLDQMAREAMIERPDVGGVVRTIVRSDGREGGARILSGQGLVTETHEDLRLTVTAGAFAQVNRPQAAQLYRQVEAFAQVDGEACVLDLYCGVGAITLLLANTPDGRWAWRRLQRRCNAPKPTRGPMVSRTADSSGETCGGFWQISQADDPPVGAAACWRM